MSYIGKITTGGSTYPIGSTLYGTCTTSASTADKVAVVPGFDTLEEGVTVHIKFTYSNTSTGTITLAIKPSSDGTATTAKNIYKYGTTKPGATVGASWQAGSVVAFTYDGTYWQMNDSNTYTFVTQSEIDHTLDQENRILLGGTTGDADVANVWKSQYFTYNPSNKALTLGSRDSGYLTGVYSVGIGDTVTASANSSVAMGKNTYVSGNYGVAMGLGTKSKYKSQFVFGEYNTVDSKSGAFIPADRGNYIEIVGNGTSSVRSNARTLDWDGNEWLSESLSAGYSSQTYDSNVDSFKSTNVHTSLSTNVNYTCAEPGVGDVTYRTSQLTLTTDKVNYYQGEPYKTYNYLAQLNPMELYLDADNDLTGTVNYDSKLTARSLIFGTRGVTDMTLQVGSDDLVFSGSGTGATWDGTNQSLKLAIGDKLSRTGGSVTGSIIADGNNIYLGSSTGRFAGLYTDDINCSGWIGGNIIRCGTKTITATATNYIKVFTNSELNTLFGTTGCTNGNCVVFAMNGDYSAQSKYMSGTVYENENWYLRTQDGSNLTAGNFRVNYICVKFN